jgi:hypothetical protein
MPGIAHEAPVELLRHNPLLAAALLSGTGVTVPADGPAVMAAGDLSSTLPAELRADAVVVLGAPDSARVGRGVAREGRAARSGGRDGRLAVVVEVQMAPDDGKRRVWPAYLTLARAQHDCPAVLVVICPGRTTGRWARRPIRTGHPGFDLVPLVIDAGNTPLPGSSGAVGASPELAVLAAFTGAADLEQDVGRRLVLGAIAAADLDADRLETYTHLIRAVASAGARSALEALMTTAFKDDFIDRIKAEGRAEGEAMGRAVGRAEGEARGKAGMLLRILAARGFEVPEAVRELVLSCTDLGQLEAWGEKAATATALEDVFPG